ncbi:MAG: M3 family metallopeptidase, partial [Eubacterium sp.]|nr:M3 family metallopeptidase [Eubacterium sp.]
MMKTRRAVTVITALTLCGALCAPVTVRAEDSYYPEKDHADLDFDEMDYSTFDIADLDGALKDFSDVESLGEAEATEQIPELYDALIKGYDELQTADSLAYIYHCLQPTDQDISDDLNRFDQESTHYYDSIMTALHDVQAGKYGEILNGELSEDESSEVESYADMTEEEIRLSDELTELSTSYDEALANNDEEKMGEIYLQLVDKRTELAKVEGYDSYIDYAYENIWNRDYTPEQGIELDHQVRDELLDVIMALYTAKDKISEETSFELPDVSGKEREELIRPYIEEISPQLTEAFDYMLDHKLYDLDENPNKIDQGYTIDLPYYGAVFTYDQPAGTLYDYSTAIHEFGHYNTSYHSVTKSLFAYNIVDVAEINSQGLEMLFMPYWSEITGDEKQGVAIELEQVDQILLALISSCMGDEFEQIIYADPDMTIEDINRTYAKLLTDYGFVVESEDSDNTWMQDTHYSSQAGYMLAYSTSALSAIDIWTRSLEDRD